MSREQQFDSWAVSESPLTIEYSLAATEEIRTTVSAGYQKFARGGIEVGGILYGTVDGSTVRVLASREIPCEHALGPSFVLSDKDRAGLRDQIENRPLDSALDGLAVVGWYVSHTRSEIQLTDEEHELFDEFFAAPWAVTMVVRPGKAGSARAGFFVREPDGTVNCNQSYKEFDFPDRVSTMPDRSLRERARPAVREPVARAVSVQTSGQGYARPTMEPLPVTQSEEYSGQEMPVSSRAASSQSLFQTAQVKPQSPGPKSGWAWLFVAALVAATAAVAVLGIRVFGPRLRSEPLALSVFEREGQMLIQWNRASRPVLSAASGRLSIKDGSAAREIPLAARDLATGSFTYPVRNGDVHVRLTVESTDGKKTEEASTFLGGPPAPGASNPTEADAPRPEPD